MQNQIDKLELDLDSEREYTEKVCTKNLNLEHRIKILTEESKKKEVKSLLYFECETQAGNDKERTLENEILKVKLEHSDDVIEELKTKVKVKAEIEKEQKDQIKELTSIIKENATLENEVFQKHDEITQLRASNKNLQIVVCDQKDEFGVKDKLLAEIKSRR